MLAAQHFQPRQQPQKRKFGSLKWRGCSLAISRALYRSSTTHDIPYENQSACGACGVREFWKWGLNRGRGRLCMREASDFYEDFLVLHLSLQTRVLALRCTDTYSVPESHRIQLTRTPRFLHSSCSLLQRASGLYICCRKFTCQIPQIKRSSRITCCTHHRS